MTWPVKPGDKFQLEMVHRVSSVQCGHILGSRKTCVVGFLCDMEAACRDISVAAKHKTRRAVTCLICAEKFAEMHTPRPSNYAFPTRG